MFSLPARPTLPLNIKSTFQTVQLYFPLNFITLHYIYYIAVCMISAIIFWGSSTPAQSISFTDSLFLTVSAMTQAGLNTVNLSELNTWQQIILFIQMLIGSAILISCAVVHTRKKAFEKRFASVIEKERQRRKALRSHVSFSRSVSQKRMPVTDAQSTPVDGLVRNRAIRSELDLHHHPEKWHPAGNPLSDGPANGSAHTDGPADANASGVIQKVKHQDDSNRLNSALRVVPPPIHDVIQRIKFADVQPGRIMSPRPFQDSPTGMSRENLRFHTRSAWSPWRPSHDENGDNEAIRASMNSSRRGVHRSTSKYFDSDGIIGRNSQFHSLSTAERESLGGVEYRAVVLLEYIVIAYFVLFQLLGCIGLGAWIAYNDASTTLNNGLNPWWTGAFLAVSAFNNNGMSLLDANMVAFQSSIYVLTTAGLLILAGNTSYPVFLRLIIWSLFKLLPQNDYFREHRQTLRFLLDHPRRCYTTLFPSSHTWWLVGSLTVLNGIDWMAFEVLNINNGSIYIEPNAPKVLDGLFQALAVRSGGFYVVPVANLRVGLLVLYVLMMYISVYPVTITIRNSNVYEERSLGIYADDPDIDEEGQKGKSWVPTWLSAFGRPSQEGSRSYFVRQQLRGQLAHDLWWICLAVLFIMITETQSFGRDPVTFAVFNVVFETVSAYGCVGISTGAPGVNFSFCGEWHVLMAIDRAVLLPGEHLAEAEEEDAALRREITLERKHKKRRDGDVLGTGDMTSEV